jgi:hypothetical protein
MSLTVQGVERYKPENPYNYTEEQLDKKKLAMLDIAKLYPDVSPYYAELVYDMCVNKTEEELEEIKKTVINTPPKYSGEGGVSYTLEIIDKK